VGNRDEYFPEGRDVFYEGDDPAGFAVEMRELYGIDVTASGDWSEEDGWGFEIPAGLVEEIYGSDRWVIGS
jgi:hypothetical protein